MDFVIGVHCMGVVNVSDGKHYLAKGAHFGDAGVGLLQYIQ